MVKILNKLAILAAAVGVVPVGLPFLSINFTKISTHETTLTSIYPWGVIGGGGALFFPIINLILFMVPVIAAPALAIYASTRMIGGKTMLGLAGFISAFGIFQWFLQLGAFIGSGSDIPNDLSWEGGLSFGFYVALAATVLLFASIFVHPRPGQITPDLELLQPYQLDEKSLARAEQTGPGEFKFCPYCGEKIPLKAVFCPKCGASTSADRPSSDEVKEYDINIEDGDEKQS